MYTVIIRVFIVAINNVLTDIFVRFKPEIASCGLDNGTLRFYFRILNIGSQVDGKAALFIQVKYSNQVAVGKNKPLLDRTTCLPHGLSDYHIRQW